VRGKADDRVYGIRACRGGMGLGGRGGGGGIGGNEEKGGREG